MINLKAWKAMHDEIRARYPDLPDLTPIMKDDLEPLEYTYTNATVLAILEDLSMHTDDELQSRIQEVFMWLREQSK